MEVIERFAAKDPGDRASERGMIREKAKVILNDPRIIDENVELFRFEYK